MTEIECPLCGNYTGKPKSVKNHIFRKTDPDHKGYNWQDADALIGPGNGGPDEPVPEETQDSPGNAAEDTPDENPGETPDEPSPNADPAAAGPDGPTDAEIHCPDCGPRGELVDYREHDEDPEQGFETPDDFYCTECGQGWNDE